MLTFEQAEEMLTPEQRNELAHAILERLPLPDELSEAQQTFCMGLEVYCEYECRQDVERYFL